MRLLVAFVLLACAATSAYADSSAAERNNAREHYEKAKRHYNLSEFADALKDFKEAYRNFEDPTFLFNIGQCERQLNHKPEAVRAYRAYLRNAGDVPNRDEVNQIIVMLDKAIADEASARRQPSQDTIAPANDAHPSSATPEPTPALVVTAPPPPAPSRATPVYKRWWLWTAVGVVAAGAAVGLGVGLTRTPAAPTANTDFGTFHY